MYKQRRKEPDCCTLTKTCVALKLSVFNVLRDNDVLFYRFNFANYIFGIAYYGAYADDKENNLGIPTKGEISEINSKIYNLKCKMAEEFKDKKCDIDDYEDLCELVSNYDKLVERFCYKIFLYGLTSKPKNLG